MVRSVFGRLLTEIGCVLRGVQRRSTPGGVSLRGLSGLKDGDQFDLSLLELLVCPLSKKPLRYAAETNELINEELGIAYPIIDGIPNMIPQDARLIRKHTDPSPTPTQA
ncbi:protein preY, mitochondrial isoform X1 [Gymnodraco acuticeps]|uniref:Protein preY, mitochondrial n=1 Tax=Gymnodraco acuticeps TaxID=8218 RepID=A0A6P8UYD2_GYMAC|nr:protein preY, mitochondrial isoform X1 [Gymnodraco acuticeps]